MQRRRYDRGCTLADKKVFQEVPYMGCGGDRHLGTAEPPDRLVYIILVQFVFTILGRRMCYNRPGQSAWSAARSTFANCIMVALDYLKVQGA
jgi:hypothetical protein